MFDDDNYYDYDSIAKDADDLYFDEYDNYDSCDHGCGCESWSLQDIENVEQNEWENYYHNLTDEIIDD